MKKRILLVGNNLRTHLNFRLDLMRFLKSKGYDVTVACPYNESQDVLSIELLRKEEIKLIKFSSSNRGSNPFKDLSLFFSLISIFKKEKPDLILSYTIKPVIYGSLAAALVRVPHFAVITGLGYAFVNNDVKAHLARLLYKIALSFSGLVLFLNEEDRNLFLTKNLAKQKNSCVLPGEGFDEQKFSPNLEKVLPNNKIFRFLFIGRILYDKGIREYVEMAREIKMQGCSAEFLVLGELGAENPSAVSTDVFQSWINEGNIKYLGFSNAVKEVIDTADCVVLPSYREGIPKVLLEAAAMEKPIITTDVPGCRDVIKKDMTGLLVQERSVKSLVEAGLKMLHASNEEIKKMGTEGRSFVIDKFSNQAVFNKYTEIMNDFFSNRTPRL